MLPSPKCDLAEHDPSVSGDVISLSFPLQLTHIYLSQATVLDIPCDVLP